MTEWSDPWIYIVPPDFICLIHLIIVVT
jgi:hypothetical protein